MQRLGLLGLSYRTADQSVIARSALGAPLGESIRRLHERCGFAESVYLGTCNRVEWVFVPPDDADPADLFPAIQRELPVEAAQCYQLTGEDAARHVFEVAASLDSMNPGETQVVGQVREAYRRSSELGLAGPRLHLLFEAALRAAKRVRRETALTARPVSMMSLALDVAGDLPAGSTVAVVGAGEMAEEAADRLQKRHGLELLFTNRTLARAEALASLSGGRATALDRFVSDPPKIGALIAAVSVATPLFTRAVLERVKAAAGSALPVVIDLGVPANVDGAAARTLGFRYYGVDDLRAQGEENRRRLEAEIAAARGVLEEELAEFRSAMLEKTLAPVLAAWRRRAQHTLDEGLTRLFTSEEGRWNEDERERIERWAASLVERLAHLPMVGMRKVAAEHGVEAAHTFLSAVGARLEEEESTRPEAIPR
ncbi:MAG TPA: glutamyl-tRNA reductase [Gemmatimonadales bacterium]|nr:glutamyl-tRNA reductase [Gemmatimonadales bacterium]